MREDSEPNLVARISASRLAIAIDGPAGAGKTTVGCGLARILCIPVLDTGLMYRAVTKRFMDRKRTGEDVDAPVSLAREMTFALRGTGDATRLLADKAVLDERDLHRPDIDRAVPVIAANSEVRIVLVTAQRALARNRAIVVLGRDIGTVVLPNAEVKLYLTADPRTRAIRRERDHPAEPNLLADIHRRDSTDAGRAVSPMKPAPDAIIIDTSELTVEECINRALDAVRNVAEVV